MTDSEYKHIYTIDLNKLINENNDIKNYLQLINIYAEDELIDNFDFKF